MSDWLVGSSGQRPANLGQHERALAGRGAGRRVERILASLTSGPRRSDRCLQQLSWISAMSPGEAGRWLQPARCTWDVSRSLSTGFSWPMGWLEQIETEGLAAGRRVPRRAEVGVLPLSNPRLGSAQRFSEGLGVLLEPGGQIWAS
jgi:hypothetical protein